MVIEASGQSQWICRCLEGLGHEVIVANPRQVLLISKSARKTDRNDAQLLARLGRVDPELLRPVTTRPLCQGSCRLTPSPSCALVSGEPREASLQAG